MALAFNKLQPFVGNLANAGLNLGSDQITIALTNTSPTATAGTIGGLTQINYSNLSSRNVTTTSSTQTSGTYNLILQGGTSGVFTLTATGAVASFRYIYFYDSTVGLLIGYYDYGSAVTLSNGDTFVITLDVVNGLISIT